MIENIAQVLQLGLSGVLAVAVVALWQETRRLRQEQRDDSLRWQQILLEMLQEGREDRKALAERIGVELPESSARLKVLREGTDKRS
jgi:hypothetical protein